VLGEVDVFQIEPDHELYGHMNVNYLKLDRVPRYDESWGPILKALRDGRFFVTTGEVLITDFMIGGQSSRVSTAIQKKTIVQLKLTLRWTFPLAHCAACIRRRNQHSQPKDRSLANWLLRRGDPLFPCRVRRATMVPSRSAKYRYERRLHPADLASLAVKVLYGTITRPPHTTSVCPTMKRLASLNRK
jgi:hypothetical protein